MFEGVVLTGGRSSRMGRDKARLPHPVSGQPLVAHQAALLREAGAGVVWLATRAGEDYPEADGVAAFGDGSARVSGLRRVYDDGEYGPLPALAGALEAASSPLVLVVAVDMPALTAGHLEALLAASNSSEGCGAVARGADGGAEPFCAVYPREPMLEACRAAMAEGRLALRPVLAAGVAAGWLRVTDAVPAEALANWNTPADMGGARRA